MTPTVTARRGIGARLDRLSEGRFAAVMAAPGLLLVALFIWIAENLGTWARAWIYPDQEGGWTPVSLAKLGSWYLLMIISVVLVSLVQKPQAEPTAS